MSKEFYLARAAEHVAEAKRFSAERKPASAAYQMRQAERWFRIVRKLEWAEHLRPSQSEAA